VHITEDPNHVTVEVSISQHQQTSVKSQSKVSLSIAIEEPNRIDSNEPHCIAVKELECVTFEVSIC
jgi:hypothetical protein